MRALLSEMAPATFRVLQGQARDVDTDVALVEALRRGEARAELAAWNRFAVGVDQTLRRLLGPGPDREDLLQEVFIRFFRRVGSLREPTAVRGFLTGICIHVVRGEIARLKRRSSRNATCCDHGRPTITRKPCRAASSSRSRRGGV